MEHKENYTIKFLLTTQKFKILHPTIPRKGNGTIVQRKKKNKVPIGTSDLLTQQAWQFTLSLGHMVAVRVWTKDHLFVGNLHAGMSNVGTVKYEQYVLIKSISSTKDIIFK